MQGTWDLEQQLTCKKLSGKNALYQALDTNILEFRLVRLLDRREGKISCEMATFPLSDQTAEDVQWRALSYCWGTTEASKEILVNNQCVLIRPNLYQFLDGRQEELGADWFFVDAICINQSDPDERSAQVKHIGEVYKKAQETMIWIVADEAEIAPDSELAQTIEAVFNKKLGNMFGQQWRSSADFLTDETRQYWAEHQICWAAYWSRLWIVQEILLSETITVHVGEITYPLDYLYQRFQQSWDDATERIKVVAASLPRVQFRPTIGYILNMVWLLRGFYDLGHNFRTGHKLPFHEAVAMYGRHGCVDVRDRVFGLLAITQSVISPDYNMLPMTLFVEALCNYLLSVTSETESAASSGSPSNSATMSALYICTCFGVEPLHPVIYYIGSVLHDLFCDGEPQRVPSRWFDIVSLQILWQTPPIKKRRWYETKRMHRKRARSKMHEQVTKRELAVRAELAALSEEALMEAPRLNGVLDVRTKTAWKEVVETSWKTLRHRFDNASNNAGLS